MQTLKTYLADRKKSDFARKLRVSASQLSQYLSGERRPSYDRMLEVERLTGGEVTVQSWQHIAPDANASPANQGDAA